MAEVLYNSISASCASGPCINLVAGYLDNNPSGQLSACQSIFGFPTVPTVTLPAEDALQTRTLTATSVVIVVTTSTAYSTAEETSTAYDTLYSTVTEYTRTITNTVLTTTTASAAITTVIPPARKRSLRRRGACKPKTTTTSDLSPTGPASCPNLAAYSSACACIQPSTVTQYGSSPTSFVDEIVTVSAASTVETVVTVGVTTVVVKPATTTIITTISTETAATTTQVSTVNPAPPTPTKFNLELFHFADEEPSPREFITIAGSAQGMAMKITTTPPSPQGLLYLPPGGGRPWIVGATDFVMWNFTPAGSQRPYIGTPVLQTPAYASVMAGMGTWGVVTCTVHPDVDLGTSFLNCKTNGRGDRFFRCGNDVYLTYNATPFPECEPLLLKVVPV
ncbi:hypothetical protein QBC43DRAFT_95304 [Cladorrhinum sp. PSN259]|nr:hypothetical protein QBC43DRAFT_95304 [Cladorrhinum sp. PSN259]